MLLFLLGPVYSLPHRVTFWLCCPMPLSRVTGNFRIALLLGSQRLAGHCCCDDRNLARIQMTKVVDDVGDSSPTQYHFPDHAGHWCDVGTVASFYAGSKSTICHKVNSSCFCITVIGLVQAVPGFILVFA